MVNSAGVSNGTSVDYLPLNLTTLTSIEDEDNIGEEFEFSFNGTESSLVDRYRPVLIIASGTVATIGFLANLHLVVSLCSRQGARSRNPLLHALWAADLLVCAVSLPITMLDTLTTLRPWIVVEITCKIIFFLQALPVAASTLSLMMIALDRYATLQHPRLMSRLHRRSLLSILAATVWLLAGLLAAPTALVRQNNIYMDGCEESWRSHQLRRGFLICHLCVVFVIPVTTVMVCHLAVRAKLTALSLTARAAHGELPLPIPLLRRPTHVIIVAGVANNTHAKVLKYHTEPNSNDYSDGSSGDLVGGIGTVDRLCGGNRATRQQKTHRSASGPRQAASTEAEIRRQHRRKRQKPNGDTDDPRPVTSTLRSRRRLANVLLSAAAAFAAFWLPHVAIALCIEASEETGSDAVEAEYALPFTLLLGQAHSVINPLFYWVLDRQAGASTSGSGLCGTGPGMRALLCWQPANTTTSCPPASSTNEAALGPFNPRFVRSVHRQPQRPAESSHYLY